MQILLVSVIILTILDFYIFSGLKASGIRWVQSRTFGILWWAYSLGLLVGVGLAVYADLPLGVRAVILVALFITFTCKAVYMLILLMDDIRRGAVWVKRLFSRKTRIHELDDPLPEKDEKGISRSAFLTRAGILVAAVPFSGLTWGLVYGGYDYRIRRVKLYLPNLPKAFHGLTIGQISDIHSGSFFNAKSVSGGVDMLLAEKPDVIFFTGDLINSLANEMRDYQDLFSKVKAPLGVFSSLGNHDYGEYYFGKEPSPAKARNLQHVKDTHRVMGWDLLLNEHRALTVNKESIGILGVENWGTGRFPKFGDINKTLQGTEEFPVKLLLSHDPSHWRAQVLDHKDIDVMFSGHTHGMQFGVRLENYQWSPIQYIYKEWAGLYQEGSQRLYVNVGYGFLGYPGRVGILPEITIFELRSEAEPA
ncbi:hypothetical protein SAMN05216436_1036 [bacterium A37T11]|nr:hypothetical protein SAMN05216436_1036 [bacterium A37T11]